MKNVFEVSVYHHESNSTDSNPYLFDSRCFVCADSIGNAINIAIDSFINKFPKRKISYIKANIDAINVSSIVWVK